MSSPTCLHALSNMLWRQRQLLDLLLFKLEEEQLLLAAGRSRWLAHATREVEAVLEQIRHQELERAIQAETTADELGSPHDASLRDLAARAPEPWDGILLAHHDGLAQVVHEIDEVARRNRDLLGQAEAATREALEGLEGHLSPPTYARTAATGPVPGGQGLFDRAI